MSKSAAATKTGNPTSITLSAPIELSSQGDGKPSKFQGVAYSGGVVSGYGAIVDVETTEVPQRMPLLWEHGRSGDPFCGVVEASAKSAGQISVSGELFSDMPGSMSERVALMSKRGMPFQMSIGIYNYSEEYVPRGVKASVNGRDIEGPVTILRRGKVRECSIVILGADHNTEVKLFSQPEGDNHLESEDDTMNAEQLKALQDELAALKASVAEKDSELVKLKQGAEQAAKAARETALSALFSDIKQKPSDAQRASFLAMSDAEFTAAADVLRSMAKNIPAQARALFTDTVTGETEDKPAAAPALNFSAIYEKRRKAAAAATVA